MTQVDEAFAEIARRIPSKYLVELEDVDAVVRECLVELGIDNTFANSMGAAEIVIKRLLEQELSKEEREAALSIGKAIGSIAA